MRTLSQLLVVIALILAVIYIVLPGHALLIGLTAVLVCMAMLMRDYGK